MKCYQINGGEVSTRRTIHILTTAVNRLLDREYQRLSSSSEAYMKLVKTRNDLVMDLLGGMLTENPQQRVTASQVVNHAVWKYVSLPPSNLNWRSLNKLKPSTTTTNTATAIAAPKPTPGVSDVLRARGNQEQAAITVASLKADVVTAQHKGAPILSEEHENRSPLVTTGMSSSV